MQLTPPHIPDSKIIEVPETTVAFNDFISDNRKITEKPELEEDIQQSYDLWFKEF